MSEGAKEEEDGSFKEKSYVVINCFYNKYFFNRLWHIFKKTDVESEASVKHKVVEHLLSEGYKEDEFKVDVKYHKIAEGKYGGPYAINVIFNDETNVIYNYEYKSESKDITQIGVAPMKGKNDKKF